MPGATSSGPALSQPLPIGQQREAQETGNPSLTEKTLAAAAASKGPPPNPPVATGQPAAPPVARTTGVNASPRQSLRQLIDGTAEAAAAKLAEVAAIPTAARAAAGAGAHQKKKTVTTFLESMSLKGMGTATQKPLQLQLALACSVVADEAPPMPGGKEDAFIAGEGPPQGLWESSPGADPAASALADALADVEARLQLDSLDWDLVSTPMGSPSLPWSASS